MNKPNFLVVGAAKCGTTSLYGYLKQHPEVFLPEIKEGRYFSNIKDKVLNPFTNQKFVEVISNSNEYYSLFKSARGKALGDISPDYLYYFENSIKKIKNELGDKVKIIILLRNPIDRAISSYLHTVRDGNSNISFEESVNVENSWVKKNIWFGFYNTKQSFYYNSVKAYLDSFRNVKVIIFEDFIRDQSVYLEEICDFLNINRTFKFSEPTFTNKTGVPKSKIIDVLIRNQFPFKKILKSILKLTLGNDLYSRKISKIRELNLKKPEFDYKIKEKLLSLFLEDIEKLEKLLETDLAFWKQV